ncbi:MAG TPA: hypothetical protein VFU49_13260 [Ktedonobacteraceae bacterium]|nr:hypothetical protein [Ktedonobacteraceae bacterium]
MSQTPQTSEAPQPQMAQKRPFLSPRARVILGISVIAVLVVLSFFAPPEGDTNNVTGDPVAVPTVTITHLIETVNMQRTVTVDGVQISVTKAMLASQFSDDRKRAGTYTVRVLIQTAYNGQAPLGISYDSLIRLQMADGTVIVPKLMSIQPVEIPGRSQTGFVDFPLAAQMPLADLKVSFGSDVAVPLMAG